MKNKKLLMPLALVLGMFMFSNTYAAKLYIGSLTTGIPFTAKYLHSNRIPNQMQRYRPQNVLYNLGTIEMLFEQTADGLYMDWTITLDDGTNTYTWRTNDSSQGSIRNFPNNYSFTAYNVPPAGTYTVSVQCNDSDAYRDDIVITGDVGGGSVQNYDGYSNAFVVTGVQLFGTANGGIGIDTSTNY